ncbi:prolipoprotein diacylglyceryl transferase [Synechococcus sp. CB0101]|jgi:phosphatidylglycerol:prolipoprotein diacylglycerol transferase|uniref:prolipoprotein diacylglyceryl transferase n=1 Tax=Synechococcus sp. CB0101 TaxID=232348 RepID=UPI0002001D83|nr:prolipoprotein diacylglyceryl transferase [Synechococcus sp. CB0101]QCH15742.1 prolipoprotein diacylglyceryl transferase [Synechococcus sp. CB0101]
MPLALFTSPGPLLFQLGPFSLRWYGLLIAVAVLLGLLLATRLGKQRGIDPALIADLLPILVLAAVIGARLYYVTFEWRQYQLNWLDAFAIWRGGIAIHGALIGGTLAVILYSRWRRIAFWNLLDVLLPSVALGQAIGRWGNFFNSEAFGLPTDLPWKLTIPYANRPVEFLDQSTFHPTFLYESLWNLGVLALLLVLFERGVRGKIQLPMGAISCFYLVAYSAGRFWIEGLRIDPLCLMGTPPDCDGGLRMAQLVSLLLIGLGALGLYWLYGRRQPLPDPSGVQA